MIFFLGSAKKRRLKKLKQRLLEEYNRRVHMIVEAQRKHEKNRKEARTSSGGFVETKSMEEQDLGFAVGQGVAKTIVMAGNALERIKKRQKSIDKNRKTHLAKLQKARTAMKKRQR